MQYLQKSESCKFGILECGAWNAAQTSATPARRNGDYLKKLSSLCQSQKKKIDVLHHEGGASDRKVVVGEYVGKGRTGRCGWAGGAQDGHHNRQEVQPEQERQHQNAGARRECHVSVVARACVWVWRGEWEWRRGREGAERVVGEEGEEEAGHESDRMDATGRCHT